jgi:citrate lyase subunit beta / citryl-CoA lyase
VNAHNRIGAARSFLFVPGDRPDRFRRALDSEADCVVVDLEDAVAPAAKDAARAHVRALLDRPVPRKPVIVRINSPSTPPGAADVAALSTGTRPAGVMVPKADSPAVLAELGHRLGANVALLPLVETAAGLIAAPQIAALPGVARLALGHLDLAAELGIDPADENRLGPARFALAVASAAAGLPAPVDGVSTEVRAPSRVETETRHTVAAGFTARLCIHPDQVRPVHTGLLPPADELTWARSVLGAVRGGDVAVVDGQMVDRPVLLRARSVLARAAEPTGSDG